jgi:GxxExxY protein
VVSQKEVNDIAYKIVGCAIEVHKNLGPGLLESVYESCFIEELTECGLRVQSQVCLPVTYKGRTLDRTFRLDLLINEIIIVEIKAVEVIIPLYAAQLLSYLRLTGKPKGLLINFNCENIVKQAIHLVTKEFANLPKT